MPIEKRVAGFKRVLVTALLVNLWFSLAAAGAAARFHLEKDAQGNFRPFQAVSVPLPDFIKEYSRSTGTPIALSGTWDQDLAGSVTLFLRHPVKAGQMTELVYRILNDNGYAVVDAPAGNGWLIEKIRDARDAPLPVYDASQLPVTNRLVTAMRILKYADAEGIARTMRSLMPSYSRIIPATSSQLLITDTGANIRKLLTVMSLMDTEEAAKRTRDALASYFPPGPPAACGEQRIAKLVVEKLEIQEGGNGSAPGRMSGPGVPPAVAMKRMVEGAGK